MRVVAAIADCKPPTPASPIVRIELALEYFLAVAAAIEELRARGWKYDA
jgi:hypothetical protein